jgi:hypothetical protein
MHFSSIVHKLWQIPRKGLQNVVQPSFPTNPTAEYFVQQVHRAGFDLCRCNTVKN